MLRKPGIGGCMIKSHNKSFQIKYVVDLIDENKIKRPKPARSEPWSDQKASLFIESFFLRMPINPLYLVEDTTIDPVIGMRILDGTRRLQALRGYIKDKYALTGVANIGEMEGKKFSELELKSQRVLLYSPVNCVIVSQDTLPKYIDLLLRYLL
jgi:hypothetical protein